MPPPKHSNFYNTAEVSYDGWVSSTGGLAPDILIAADTFELLVSRRLAAASLILPLSSLNELFSAMREEGLPNGKLFWVECLLATSFSNMASEEC